MDLGEQRRKAMERFDVNILRIKERSEKWFEYNRQRYGNERQKVDKVEA